MCKKFHNFVRRNKWTSKNPTISQNAQPQDEPLLHRPTPSGFALTLHGNIRHGHSPPPCQPRTDHFIRARALCIRSIPFTFHPLPLQRCRNQTNYHNEAEQKTYHKRKNTQRRSPRSCLPRWTRQGHTGRMRVGHRAVQGSQDRVQSQGGRGIRILEDAVILLNSAALRFKEGEG